MSGTAVMTDLASAIAGAHAAVDELQAAPLDLATEDELLGLWRELERLARRLPSVEHRLVPEAETRGLPGSYGCRSTGQFLRNLLRLDPGEAHARAAAADAAGPRRATTGEPLPPAYPAVAAAQAAGIISPRHARIVTETVEHLPDPARWAKAEQVESQLVEYATVFDPRQLARLALRVRDCLDPDGVLHDTAHRERTRGLCLHRRADGSGHLEGECTAELAERLDVLFDAFAAPKPEIDGVKDPRTAAQRRHDALLDALAMLQRGDCLPKTTGVPATIVVTMTGEQYVTGHGLAVTGHGALVPAQEALRWAGADHRRLAVVLDKVRGITGYSSTQRIFTEQQRLALIARDSGCTFVGCDAPPAWCEVHHLVDYADGGATSLDNAALVCRHDHRHRIGQGWRAELINGRVGWIPPRWIDPRQVPRFNTRHDIG